MPNRTASLVAIAGSLRREAYSRRLVGAAIDVAPAGVDVRRLSIRSVPPYDADVEAAGLPRSVKDLKQAIDGADGLLIATPEYNWSIPGVLKNALDWASRPAFRSPLAGKLVAVVAASPGRGGARRALDDLRQVLDSVRAELVAELSIAEVHEKFRGDELEPTTLQQLRDVVGKLAGEAKRLAAAS
ncbi:MAG: NADPH-dependent FMN reductase [Candidatus Limnocylindria bacterium]